MTGAPTLSGAPGISYQYDAASRRSTAQVAGQSQVQYTHDNANRLTQIAQGSSTVGFSYDLANRRSTLTLPNNIVASYSYDQDSRLTGISYSLGGNAVGSLGYTYDALGRRTALTGTMAATGFPATVSSATYDAANELTNWNGTTITYDSDGNMLSDGTHSYTWDARNQLSMIDSGSTGSFVYDPFGRRATKSLLGTATNFFYDGANPVQELLATTPTSNLLTGGLDEYFTRTDSNGVRDFLTDMLGSTLALTDSSGLFQTQYSYDPFGSTTPSGATSGSAFQYTGRENDSAGLYFYRSRYYSTALQRFISEDPIGFQGGGNFYTYVSNSPLNLTDPTGLKEYPNGFIGPLPATGYRTNEMTMTRCGGIPPHPTWADVDRNMEEARHHWDLRWFEHKVEGGGDWDYKRWDLKYADFGNYNYGAAGTAFGFPENTLRREAGRAQAPGTGDGGDPGSRWNPWGGTPPYGDLFTGPV